MPHAGEDRREGHERREAMSGASAIGVIGAIFDRRLESKDDGFIV